ncbi:MAG: hypothetical protein L0Z50_39125 [Verrucomicrobiales bacterium]|nr:hypothetical protein [Verrucomicrobiales bacterium]
MPTLDTTETAILSRAINSAQPSWSPDAARSILDIKLTDEDARRRDELAEKARQGTLSDQEAAELRNYGQVGRILELMKAKAKVSLSKTTLAS